MMKKILAAVLALMLLAASAALADPATKIVISQPVVTMTSGGQTQETQINGLVAEIASGAYGEIPTIQLDITGDSEKLAGAVMQIVGSKLVMLAEGMSVPVCADLGDTYDASMTPTLAQAMPMLNELFNAPVPQFEGLEIPLADLTQLVAAYADGEGHFALSMDQVYDLAEAVLDAADSTGANISQLETAKMYLPMLRKSGMGIEIDGTAACDGTVSTLNANIYLVQNSKRDDSFSIAVNMESAVNHFGLEIPMLPVTFAMDSDPESKTLSVALQAAGEAEFLFRLYPQDGLTLAALSGKASDQSFDIGIGYGSQEDLDVFCLNMQAAGTAMNLRTDTLLADEIRTGKVKLTVENPDNTAEITADVAVLRDEAEIRTIPNADEAVDVQNMTQAQQEQLSAEATQAFSGVVDFINKKAAPAQ